MLNKWFQKFSRRHCGSTPLSLTDLRRYINGEDPTHPPSEAMLIDVLKHVMNRETPSEAFPQGKRCVDTNDNDVRIKKLLDLGLSIARSKKVGVESLAMLLEFIDMYDDIIEDYDTRHKEIYKTRFLEQVKSAITTVETKMHLHDKFQLLYSRNSSNR